MILAIKGEQYQLRRFDARNLVIERLQKPKDSSKEASRWEPIGYYGNLGDLISALLKMNIDVPEGLSASMVRLEIKRAERSILEAIKRWELDCTSLQRQPDDH